MTSMTEEIDVEVDPMTAFTVFTDEFDQWWGNGPIDAYERGGSSSAASSPASAAASSRTTATRSASPARSRSGSPAPGWRGRRATT